MSGVTFTQEDLSQFTGTESYYRSSPLVKDIVHTDGIQHIAANGGAWMVDVIVSHQFNKKVRAAEFQVWEFQVNADDSSCRAVCTDGMSDEADPAPLVAQEIPYTDLKFNVKMFLELGSLDMVNPMWVILLPSEH